MVAFAALVIGMLAASTAWAQAAKPAAGPESHNAVRLGGPTRFGPAMRNVAALQKTFAQPRMQADLRKAFAQAGIESVTDQFLKAIADGNLKEVSVPVGARMQWMASRSPRTRQPHVLYNVTWAGKKPFDAWEIVIDDLNRTYTFWIPKVCANIAVSTSEPSREKARLDAIAAEQARQEQERRDREAAAEKARQEALAKQRAEQERLEKERAAAAAAAAEKARLEQERLAREEAERQRLEEERRREQMKFFVAGFFGKERRVREVEPAAGAAATTTALESGVCAPLVGFKAGPIFRVNKAQTVEIAPAIGVALNTKTGSHSSLFGEVELNGRFNGGKTYLGTGIGAWDLTHSGLIAPVLLVNFGQQVWQNERQNRAFFTVEGRLFLDQTGDIANNYQFWGGIRYMWR